MFIQINKFTQEDGLMAKSTVTESMNTLTVTNMTECGSKTKRMEKESWTSAMVHLTMVNGLMIRPVILESSPT